MTEKINGYRADMAGLGEYPGPAEIGAVLEPIRAIEDVTAFRVSEGNTAYRANFSGGLYDVQASLRYTAQSSSPNIKIVLSKPTDYDANAPIHEFDYEFVEVWHVRRPAYEAYDVLESFRDVAGKPLEAEPLGWLARQRRDFQCRKLARQLGTSAFTRDHFNTVKAALTGFNMADILAEKRQQEMNGETD